MFRTPTNAIPFSLVYGREVVLLLEIQITYLHISLAIEMIQEDKHRLRLQELEALDDKWLQLNNKSSSTKFKSQ